MSENENSQKKRSGKTFGHLMSELDFDYCLQCGSCVASCPVGVLQLGEKGPEIAGGCISCGLCYSQCPQLVSTAEVAEHVFGEEFDQGDFGPFKRAYSAHAKNPEVEERGQDGGVITALLVSLLENNYIDGAVLTASGDEPWRPESKVAVDKEEIIESAGTIYTREPKILGVRNAIDVYGLEKIAVVGTPCQMRALRIMETSIGGLRNLSSRIKLLIGLFCFESFPYSNLKKVVEKELNRDLENVEKMDIEKGTFILYSEGKPNQELPVSSLKKHAAAPCKVCEDFAAELADISVGSVGAPSGQSMVLLRTARGMKAFDRALDLEPLELKPLEKTESGVKFVGKISSNKKERAQTEIEERKEANQSLPPNVD